MKRPAVRSTSSPLSHHLLSRGTLAGLALLTLATFGRAADYTWDNSPSAGLQDGAGSWGANSTSTAQQNWSLDGTGARIAWPNTGTDNAIIGSGGTAGNITLVGSTTNTVGNLTFNAVGSGLYSLSPGGSVTTKIKFIPGSTVTVAAGVMATNIVPIDGLGFIKAGPGALFLRPSTDMSNCTGVITVTAGRLVVNAGSSGRYAMGPGGAKVTGGTLQIGGDLVNLSGASNDQVEDSASITNAGGIIDYEINDTIANLVMESGILTNTYTGGTRTLVCTNSINLQSGQISSDNSGTRKFSLNGTNGMGVTKSGSGNMILGPSFAGLWTGATVISNGTLSLVGTATLLPTSKIQLATSNAVFDVTGLITNFGIGAAQQLAGNGTVNGNLIFATGATLQPGYSANKMTINGSITLNNTAISVDLNGATLGVGTYRLLNYTGAKAGVFSGVTLLNGSASDTFSLNQSVTGRVDLVIGTPCDTAAIDTQPTSQTAVSGGGATFSLSSSSSSPTYQWQVSTDNGATFNNVSTGTNGNTASYTTGVLSLGNSGNKFRAIVSVACDASSITSSVATLTVTNAPIYRTAGSGNWTNTATWEASADSGGSWSPAANTPTANNTTSILVRTGHSVTNDSNLGGVDDLTVQSGATVVVRGTTFTVVRGFNAVDCDVSGTLFVDSAAGSFVSASGILKFESGGKFQWASTANGTTLPTATWATGSTCEVTGDNGTTAPSGVGQTFHNFTWNYPTASGSITFGVGFSNVLGDINVYAPNTVTTALKFYSPSATANATYFLNLGGSLNLNQGFLDLFGGGGSGNLFTDIATIQLGGNLNLAAGTTLDVRNSSTSGFMNINFTNTASPQAINLNGTAVITNTAGNCSVVWRVYPGVTLNLQNGNLQLNSGTNYGNSVVVNGTFNLGTNKVTGVGALTMGSTGTLASTGGTNQLTTGLSNIAYAGTLSLANLPPLANGSSFKLFDATTYSGAFTTISPATPGSGLFWDTTQLTVNGTLAVSNTGSGSGFQIGTTTLNGASFSLSGSAGAANANAGFSVITNADLTVPKASWGVLATGTCDGSGNFSYTNTIGSGRLFYDVRIP